MAAVTAVTAETIAVMIVTTAVTTETIAAATAAVTEATTIAVAMTIMTIVTVAFRSLINSGAGGAGMLIATVVVRLTATDAVTAAIARMIVTATRRTAAMVLTAAMVYHSTVIPASQTTIPVMRSASTVEAGRIVETSVTATIAEIHVRTVVEETANGIVTVDGIVPCATVPEEGMQEVVCSSKQRVLPIQQDVTQVGIAIGQVVTVGIVCGLHTQQIIQVDLIAVFILLFVQIQLIGHLVREEQSLLASLVIAHGGNRGECHEGEREGENHLFHKAYLF